MPRRLKISMVLIVLFLAGLFVPFIYISLSRAADTGFVFNADPKTKGGAEILALWGATQFNDPITNLPKNNVSASCNKRPEGEKWSCIVTSPDGQSINAIVDFQGNVTYN